MLRYISVKNFAIIENIEVEFSAGMTALTGETGAGKSLLIDAIGLLLGDRATSNVVRTGEDKAVVEGIFEIKNPRVITLLEEFDLDTDNHELVIRRQITPSNNNIIKVNGRTISLTQLKEITGLLADIHTQYDTHRLINAETYLGIIDGFHQEQTEQLIATYKSALTEYKESLKKLKRLETSSNDLLERLDLMKFQKEELESYNLSVEEEEDIKEQIDKMRNFDRIYQSLSESKVLLESSFAIDRLYDVSKQLESISTYNKNYEELMSRFESGYFELNDAYDELKSEINDLDFNPNLLEEFETRLNSLSSLQRKYRKSTSELIEYLAQISEDIENIDHSDELIEEQIELCKSLFAIVKEKADLITARRKQTSSFIEQELLNILDDLELKKAQFSIVYIKEFVNDFRQPSQFFEDGIDEVDFLITTNVGEPLKSLSKSASGGEMSRIMLGLKNLLVQSLQLSLIIFDEIDTGVSGFVASQVAKKMKSISSLTQVICITHIPQVAALSDNHLFISKSVSGGRTSAQIKHLHGEDRVYEIATMISGDHVTDAAILSAKELLQ
jgi:DNA repair protein RecN (Recombination protein N)